jgi:hypothetical protein
MTLWTKDEHEDALRALVAENLTASQIAKAMTERLGICVTRSAVIGKASRLGVKFYTSGHAAGVRLGGKMAAAASREHNRSFGTLKPARKPALKLAAKPAPEPEPEPLQPVVESMRDSVPFIERRAWQCCYPLWSNSERSGDVCGKPVAIGSMFRFCSEHYRLCVTAPRIWR